MTTTSIALAKLALSPLNVRQTTAADDTSDLEASIIAHGLLAPLTGHPMPRGKFGIIAGGRRLRALQALAERREIDAKTFMVDVSVRDESNATATEISVIENTARVALPAAEEFAAFAKLAEDGADIAAIARRFGTTELHVRQRMRLGQLHPDILAALGAGRLTLDAAKAFAATTDQALQKRVFDQSRFMPYEIRAAMKRDLSNTGVDRMLQLVTLEAYTTAGGRADEDLFMPGEARVLDVPLLRDLYEARIEAEKAALNLPDNVTLQFGYENLGAPVSVEVALSDEAQERRGAIDERCEAITDRLEEIAEWDDDGPMARLIAIAGQDQGEVNNLVAEQKRLEAESERLVELATGYPSGPVVAVASIGDGRLVLERCFRPYGWRADTIDTGPVGATSDEAAPTAPAAEPEKRVANIHESNRQTNGTVVQPEAVVKDQFGLSKDAAEAMMSIRRQTLAAIALQDVNTRRVASDFLIFSIARGMIKHDPAYSLGIGSTPRHEYDPAQAREDQEAQPAAAELKAARETIANADWVNEPSLAKAFHLFNLSSADDRLFAAAYAATLLLSRTMNAPGYRAAPHDMLAWLVDADQWSIRSWWTPDKRFFLRLPKARRLQAIRTIEPAIATLLVHLGNDELAAEAAAIMAAAPAAVTKYSMSQDACERACGWVPEFLQFDEPDKVPTLAERFLAEQAEEMAA